ETVRLPHNVEPMPLHYADSDSYQKIVGYRRNLGHGFDLSKRHFIQFDAAGHIADVYFNGQHVAHHGTGYTAFRVEITDLIDPSADNLVVVKLNTTEDPSVPPFGFVIDYLTYGGLYRHVWLDSRSSTFLADAYIRTPSNDMMTVEYTLDSREEQTSGALSLEVQLFDEDESEVFCDQNTLDGLTGSLSFDVPKVKLWSPDEPNLYKAVLTLTDGLEALDKVEKTVGFRTITTDETSILLNGEPFFIRGLNRHQCYPYIGYAAPDSLQEEDARILKEELGVNSVRTSHYPQSHAFLDACDRLGLLVFTEMPGWQHIGDGAWKDQAVQNTREMVTEYRQHPSIYMWGVRINESLDDDEFYDRTNDLAHWLDPDRPTSGVRYLEKSSLLEDVYAYNDFSHNGETPGCKPKKDVTPDMKKPLIITEANGHMFPTKSFDNWTRRQEHALRHSRVLNAAMADHQHAGCYQWCMFDYLTHKDFGSGDRVCYHGVMDTFRNPKLAAAVYSSQQDEEPVLEIGSSMDIGDYPASHIAPVFAFTNCDEVRLYKNDDLVSVFRPKSNGGMAHPPILINDFIGDLLETKEGFPKEQADAVRKSLLAASEYGISAL
ncbi:MAG: glycoside hydrolase family 2 protein, partial [Firmicutes bacterium]|nr:glycoside hydrolase family 2 protein [Bacillota bacterium]